MMARRKAKKVQAVPLGDRAAEPGAGFWRRHLQHVFVLIAFAALVAAITREPERNDIETVNLNAAVAESDLTASINFEMVDLSATQAAQEQAVDKVPDYYRVDDGLVQRQTRILGERLEMLREARPAIREAVIEALRQSTSGQAIEDVVDKAITAEVATLKTHEGWEAMPEATSLAVWVTPDLDTLPERVLAETSEGQATEPESPREVVALLPDPPGPMTFDNAETLRRITLDSLAFVLKEGVREGGPASGREVVVLRDTPVEGQALSSDIAYSEIPDKGVSAEILSARLLETAKRATRGTETEWATWHDAGLPMAAPLVRPTIQRDDVSTAAAKEQAAKAIEPVMKEIMAGENIQDRNKRWTEQTRSDAETYFAVLAEEQKPGRRVVTTAIAHAILVGLVLFCLLRSAGLLKRGAGEGETSATGINLALLLICVTALAGRLVSYFEPTGFVLPIAATGILYAILVNVPLAAMLSVLTALLVSIQYGYDWQLLVTCSAMSLAGVFSISRVRRRSDMAAASITAAAIGLLAMLAINLAVDSPFGEPALRRLLLIALNGGLCLLAVPGLLSPLERLFGITTDIQLLEYSDLNSEVLSQLAIKAPATYAHSLMLGQLAEAATDAIGANGLMARVCAYYHDIGKMRRSEYFSENQDGYNIHDELPPRLSARAIAAHVVQGAELAREYHLPKPIIDGILEHHGTCQIGYFYQQAMEQQKHGDVREEDFRYPGPKPQRPETAVLMVCDAAESGVRSIKNPTPERVREFIDKVVAQRSADRQFDDCNLTLKQLDTIAEVISQRIMVSLHTRVAYPEAAGKTEKAANVIPLAGGPS